MAKNPLVVADVTEKGLLWFRFKENPTVFLLSPAGKLQVKWRDVSEKKTLFRLVKNLLVPRLDEKLAIRPLKQQTWIEYPAPEKFRLYWCDETTDFVLKTTPDSKEGEKLSQPKTAIGNSRSGGSTKRCVKPLDVKDALEELRREFRFFREPTFNEVALKSGCVDQSSVRIGLTLGFWESQSLEEAKSTAEKAINLAGWLKFKEKNEPNPQLIALAKKAIDASSMDVIKRTKVILKNYPDLWYGVSASGV